MKSNLPNIEDNTAIAMSRDRRSLKGWFVLSVLLIYPLPQMAIDAYLPSWPAMVHLLHTSRSLLQLSLTVYVLSLGLSQLVYGPLSDRFGRRPMLLIGIGLFLFSSFACMFVDSIDQLLVLRALQGLGIGCGFTIASALLAEAFSGKMLAKMISYSSMIYSLSLMLAPVLGSYIQHSFGWQANFGAMTIYAVVLFLLVYFFVFEIKKTHLPVPLSFATICSSYVRLLTSVKFIGAVFCLILAYGVMIVFNVVGPFLFQEDLHVTVLQYGHLLIVVGAAYFLGATLNSRLVSAFGLHRMVLAGLSMMTVSGLGLLVVSALGSLTVMWLMILGCWALFSLGFIYPNCFAYALEVFPEKGYASAFIGAAILVGVSGISAVLTHYTSDYGLCLSWSIVILSLLSIISYLLTRSIQTGE